MPSQYPDQESDQDQDRQDNLRSPFPALEEGGEESDRGGKALDAKDAVQVLRRGGGPAVRAVNKFFRAFRFRHRVFPPGYSRLAAAGAFVL